MKTFKPCIAIIPAKDFQRGKSRLAGVLKEKIRINLQRWMLNNVLESVTNCNLIDNTVVVSDSIDVLNIASQFNTETINSNSHDLNIDLGKGIEWAKKGNAKSILIIPSDLPLIEKDSVTKIIEKGIKLSSVVITPSSDGGTNSLFFLSKKIPKLSFGENSFKKHWEGYVKKKIDIVSYENESLSFDLDTPDNLKKLIEHKHDLFKLLTLEDRL